MAKKPRAVRIAKKLRDCSKRKRQKAELKRLNIPLRNPKEIITEHHYMPQWYQKRFLPPDMHHFFYLDLFPETNVRPDGTKYKIRECLTLGPVRCFKQKHLYTLELFNHKSDIVERELFGDIDTRGSTSFNIFLGSDAWKQKYAHEKFNNFVEFMDAQKLRTPKGMNFIKSLCLLDHQTPNKLLVLGLLQRYRQMHCAMWSESIWEVVTAERSKVKFIICDHPVIAYNPKILFSTTVCGLKVDPPISLLGTQTIYPLDLNHCLILTNRQYAVAPDRCNPLEDRINARYQDKAIFAFQDIIHTRNLCENDVEKINYITKKTAWRYVAAPEKSWLFPENNVADRWETLRDILLPPKDKITHRQSITIGHADGSSETYDAFGRDVSDDENGEFRDIHNKIILGDELSKVLQKDCNADLHNKSLVLLESIKHIFGISKSKTIHAVRSELNQEHVRKLYRVVADVFPHKLDFCSLIPNSDKFRGVFLGDINPQTITNAISNLVHMFEEIYIINPFPNPYSMQESFSPLSNPNQFLRDTYKIVLSILMLEPFIAAGLLTVFVAPDEFDFPLKMKILRLAEKRAKRGKIDNADVLNAGMNDGDMQHIIRSLPKDYLRAKLKEFQIDQLDFNIDEILEHIDAVSKNDITDLGRPLSETGGQLLFRRTGLNLENALLFCRLTGAVPVTNIPFKYK